MFVSHCVWSVLDGTINKIPIRKILLKTSEGTIGYYVERSVYKSEG